MTQVIKENIDSVLRHREQIFFILAIGICFCVASYIFLVHKTIVNVVMRESVVKDIRNKSTAVSDIESTYLTAKNKINIDLAHAKGFEDTEVTVYISKKSLTAFVPHNEL